MSDYHSRPEVSASMLKTIAPDRWRDYEARYITRTVPPIETTKAMEWGRVVETVMLEPDRVDRVLYVGPSKSDYGGELLDTMDDLTAFCKRHDIKPGRRKSDAVAAIQAAGLNPPIWDCIAAEAKTACGERIQVTRQEYDDACEIVELAKADPNTRWLFNETRDVQPVTAWEHPGTGLACRGMADVVLPTHRTVIDVKTTKATTVQQAQSDFLKLNYWLQDAHYSEGWAADRFYFMAFTSVRPWRVFTFEYSLGDRLQFKTYRDGMMAELRRRIDANDWAEKTEGQIITLSQPDWWHNQMGIYQ
jgi:hypothetical protein